MMGTDLRRKSPWRDYLTSTEADEVAKKDARAQELDTERRALTNDLRGYRDRAMKRMQAALQRQRREAAE